MIRFETLPFEAIPWATLDRFPDRTIYQTKAWLTFLAASQRGAPVVAVIRQGDKTVGYFTGVVFSKLGVRLLGSPFRGWTTVSMGFNLDPEADRRAVLDALPNYVFGQLGCQYFEVLDARLAAADVEGLRYRSETWETFHLDLAAPEDAIWRGMKSSCQRAIRKAAKSGLTVEAAADPSFVDDYYSQLCQVFRRQNLVPTYGRDRIKELAANVLPSGHLLFLRARAADGACIATGIFPGYNDTATFWGGASLREHAGLRPNEALMWYAIRYWRDRGVRWFDLGGAAHYKEKYGGRRVEHIRLMCSRLPFLFGVRDAVQRLVRARQRLHGWFGARRMLGSAS